MNKNINIRAFFAKSSYIFTMHNGKATNVDTTLEMIIPKTIDKIYFIYL